MIEIIKDKNKLKVSKGSYELIFKDLGFEIIGENKKAEEKKVEEKNVKDILTESPAKEIKPLASKTKGSKK